MKTLRSPLLAVLISDFGFENLVMTIGSSVREHGFTFLRTEYPEAILAQEINFT